MKPDYDVVIVGGGPAGLSAALLLGRCLRRVMLYDAGNPRNAPSRAMHGYLGQDGINPAAFLEEARRQLAIYDTVKFASETVAQVELEKGLFTGRTNNDSAFSSRALLLATGVRDELPEVPSARDFYGITLHHCPYCDGWEHRGQHIGVVGNNQKAADLALELLLWSPHITLYTNSDSPLADQLAQWLRKNKIKIVEGRVTGLEGKDARLSHIGVGDRIDQCQALFFSPLQTHQSSLAATLGCKIEEKQGAVLCGINGVTNIEGVFVAGNVSTGIQMVIMAAAEGMNAAAAINDWLVCQDTGTT